MKLSVNLVGRGRYWKAGEEIPDDEVPATIRKYAVTVTGDDGVTESPAPDALEPAARRKRHIKAGRRISR
jgi:hypothetical protein